MNYTPPHDPHVLINPYGISSNFLCVDSDIPIGSPIRGNQECLCLLTREFNKNNIEHCVAWGTLLGYVRERDIIKGDKDIDFYVNLQNQSSVLDILKKNKYKLHHHGWNLRNTTHLHKPLTAIEWEEDQFVGYDGFCHSKWNISCYKDYGDQRGLVDIYFYEDAGEDYDYVSEYWNRGTWGFRGPGNPEGDITKEWFVEHGKHIRIPNEMFFPFKDGEPMGKRGDESPPRCDKIKIPNNPTKLLGFFYGARWREKLEFGTDYLREIENHKPATTYINTEKTKVYVGMAADFIHHGHINIIIEASRLGKVTVGLLTDLALASYKRVPALEYKQRKMVLENIKGITNIIPQHTLDYTDNLEKLKPNYVVHGDDWKTGTQKQTREDVEAKLREWGGQIVDVPYTKNISSSKIHEGLRI